MNVGCLLDGEGSITIKRNVHIGPGVKILSGSHVIGPARQRAGRNIASDIVIGNGVWLGAGAMILEGVNVADGCIIAAGAVVTKSTEPHGLYAGVPAKRRKDLPM